MVPAEVARPVIEALRREGRVHYGYLGVTTSAASVPSTTEPGSHVPIGALVERASSGSPADRAGMRKGDLLVGFQSDRVEYPTQLARWVAGTRPGTAARLVWVRSEQQGDASATLGDAPYDSPPWVAPKPPAGPPADDRIAEIERQIAELSRQLQALKSQQGSELR